MQNSMLKKSLALIGLSLFASSAFPLSPPAYPAWTIQNGKLLDPNGQPFFFRGVTINHTLAPEKTLQAIRDVAAAGANAAQIEFAVYPDTYPRSVIPQLRDIIAECKASKLVCVLEANDAAGYPDYLSFTSAILTSVWTMDDLKPVLAGNQNHIIIGYGNQHFAANGLSGDYSTAMTLHLTQLLNYLPPGYSVLIDGDYWGQDTAKSMLAFAQQVKTNTYLASRIIYSVDMFNAYQNPASIRDYIASFDAIDAPLVIGGFGPVAYYHPHNPFRIGTPQLPFNSVMQYAEEFGAGYFGWSWSGNENSDLDIVTNWNSAALTPWGNELINGANGIKATAKPASIYSNGSSSSSSSSVSVNNPPVAAITFNLEYVRCGQVYGNVSAVTSSDPDGDELTYSWEINGFYGVQNFTGLQVRFGMQPPHYYTIKLTVSDGKGGVSTATIVRNHTYTDYCVSSSSATSSSIPGSSSSIYSSSSIRTSSSTSSSSSIPLAKAQCSYQIQSQWGSGFTAVIRIKNTTNTVINGWDVNWQYADGSKVTNLWNANWTGANPYNAKNLNWNSTIQPGQTVEFGFQGSKPAGAASVPVITGNVCQ